MANYAFAVTANARVRISTHLSTFLIAAGGSPCDSRYPPASEMNFQNVDREDLPVRTSLVRATKRESHSLETVVSSNMHVKQHARKLLVHVT